jgi:hypothetical protein
VEEKRFKSKKQQRRHEKAKFKQKDRLQQPFSEKDNWKSSDRKKAA